MSENGQVKIAFSVDEQELHYALGELEAAGGGAATWPVELNAVQLRQVLDDLPAARAAAATQEQERVEQFNAMAAEMWRDLTVEAYARAQKAAQAAVDKFVAQQPAATAQPLTVNITVPPEAFHVVANVPAGALRAELTMPPTVTTTTVQLDSSTQRIKETRAVTRALEKP